MTPSVHRYMTARTFRRALDTHGPAHPATYAAFARAVVAWAGRIRAPRTMDTVDPPTALAVAYGRALHRANGFLVENRHARKHPAPSPVDDLLEIEGMSDAA